MAGIRVKWFNLKDTFESAQPLTFTSDYFPEESKLVYVEGDSIIEVVQDPSKPDLLRVSGTDPAAAEASAKLRLRLGDDMAAIHEVIATDDFMARAIAAYPGLRLTLNDPWEATVCFIISQFNNVKRITQITRRLMDRFGIGVEGTGLKSFPTSEMLSHASERDFLDCGAGFRAKYLRAAADYCTNNIDLNRLRAKEYPELKEELLQMTGVGDKVADCIALMGYGKLEAFPIDTWVKRILEKTYFPGKKMKVRSLHEFAAERWGALGGYAQQYLFHYGRNNNLQ